MLEINPEIPEIEITQPITDDFSLTISLINEDLTQLTIENFDPVMEISLKGETLLTLEGEDFYFIEMDLIIQKSADAFQFMSCLKQYEFRFYDRASNSTLMRGPFKVS